MKRTISVLTIFFSSNLMARGAQDTTALSVDRNLFLFAGNAIAILLTIWIASYFLLSMIRMFLNYRLRKALVEKDAPEEVITQILPQKNFHQQQSLQWSCLFAAIGLGLTLCYFNQPIGLHWAIIMSFSVATGLLAFYFIAKKLR